MPTDTLIALFAASFVLPVVVAIGVTVYGHGYTRYIIGLVGIMLALGVNIGLAAYSYPAHPEWWSMEDSSFMWALAAYMPFGTFTYVLGLYWGYKIAKVVDSQLPFAENVRQLRRSA